jgi:hypothetical protein
VRRLVAAFLGRDLSRPRSSSPSHGDKSPLTKALTSQRTPHKAANCGVRRLDHPSPAAGCRRFFRTSEILTGPRTVPYQAARGRRTPNPLSILGERVIGIAIKPTLCRLCRSDHRMPAGVRVFRRVAIRRVVTAQGSAARLARSQMHPTGAYLHALGALAPPCMLDSRNPSDMRARFISHRPPLLAQHLVHESDGDRAFTDG